MRSVCHQQCEDLPDFSWQRPPRCFCGIASTVAYLRSHSRTHPDAYRDAGGDEIDCWQKVLKARALAVGL